MSKVEHEITLAAFTTNEDGTRSVFDICETSYRNASFFMRGFYRTPEVTHVSASRPGPLHALTGKIWPINR